MASIERTAYPRLRTRLSEDERNARYTLSVEERDFVRTNARGAKQRLTLAVLLKTFQHLGYFPDLSEIPKSVLDFVGQQLDLPPGTSTLDGPRRKPTLFRYRQSVLGLLGWTVYGEAPAQQLRAMLETAAQTMSDPADLINVAVEHLVKSHIELPAFSVASDGSFVSDWGAIAVPGAANPVSASSLELDVTLVGAFCPTACGDVTGDVTSPAPIPLDGSTFFLEPIGSHTEPPQVDCAGTLADPL